MKAKLEDYLTNTLNNSTHTLFIPARDCLNDYPCRSVTPDVLSEKGWFK
jgi:hypothetical protein